MSMYIRFKRRNQTVYIRCEPSDKIGKLKDQLAQIVGVETDNLRLFPYLTAEQRIVALARQNEATRLALEEAAKRKRAARAAKAKNKKPGSKKAGDDDDEDIRIPESKSNITETLLVLPLPEARSVEALQLETGSIVFFVYRVGDGDDWEDIDVPLLQPANGGFEGDPNAPGVGELDRIDSQLPSPDNLPSNTTNLNGTGANTITQGNASNASSSSR